MKNITYFCNELKRIAKIKSVPYTNCNGVAKIIIADVSYMITTPTPWKLSTGAIQYKDVELWCSAEFVLNFARHHAAGILSAKNIYNTISTEQ